MVYPQFTSEKDVRTGEGQQLCPTTNPPGVRDKLEVKVLQRRRGHRRKPGTARSDASFCLQHGNRSLLSDNIRAAKTEQFPDDGCFTRKHISSCHYALLLSQEVFSSLTVCYRN